MNNKNLLLSILLLSFTASHSLTAGLSDVSKKLVPETVSNWLKPKELTDKEKQIASELVQKINDLNKDIKDLEKGLNYTYQVIANNPECTNGYGYLRLTKDQVNGTLSRISITKKHKAQLEKDLAKAKAQLIPFLKSAVEWVQGITGLPIGGEKDTLAELQSQQPSHKRSFIIAASTVALGTATYAYLKYKNKKQAPKQTKA